MSVDEDGIYLTVLTGSRRDTSTPFGRLNYRTFCDNVSSGVVGVGWIFDDIFDGRFDGSVTNGHMGNVGTKCSSLFGIPPSNDCLYRRLVELCLRW